MAGNRYDLHYAKNVHEQDNPNAAKRIHWSGLDKAVSHDAISKPTGSGSSYFEDYQEVLAKSGCKKTKGNPFGLCDPKIVHHYNYPYVVTAHQFDLNIPDNAYIFKVTFKVCMKVAKGVKAKAPKGIANIYGSGYYARRNTGSDGKGWINGYYHMQPDVKLSTSWKEVSYELWESNIQEGGITPASLNSAAMGLDLNFTKCGNTDGNIYIKWASVSVEYDVPDNKVFFSIPSTPENPYYVKTGDQFEVAAIHTNDTWANDVDQSYSVKIPGFGYDVSNNWGVTDTWTVHAPRKAKNWLWFTVKSHILGLNEIDVGGAKFWFYSLYGEGDDYYVVRITPSILRKGINGCIQVNAHVWDEDGIVTFRVVYSEGHGNPELSFNFNAQLSSVNVGVRSIGTDTISFSVPPRTECEVCFDVCGVPYYAGINTFKVIDDDGDEYTQEYNVLPAYTYRFCNNLDGDDETFDLKFLPDRSSFILDRFLTQTELGMYDLDAEFNAETMYMTDCSLTTTKFDELDYVGCVPLSQSHFDPKSDYSDTLLNETYKNKTYMGKKGVIDETITLNLRVPPRDVTTLQGLVEMDRPVPINTCHTAFEGDALNHRGWVELYGVKDVEKTNPNFYKIALDVKYLTHNIAHKFDILRNSKVLPDATVPPLFVETLSFDDPLSNGLNVKDDDDEPVESSDFFDVNTDGTYIFLPTVITDLTDDDEEPEPYDIYNADFNNLFTLDEGQHVRLTSHNPLSQNVKISCSWKSDKQQSEPLYHNNSLKRVFRIRNSLNKDEILFEYTYYDFNFNDMNSIKARVNSTYTNVTDGVKTLFNSEITVKSDHDYDDDGNVLTNWYGSTVSFELSGNHLTVTDTGFNGRELRGTCDLKEASYIFECEFTSLLTQSYAEDSLLYMDMEVYDTFLKADYSDMYGNLVVSPFPVVDKKVVFTRQSEEGVIYYMYDDGKPFKYLLEPYYQYHCGVDLKSREGISLFNLDNRYSIFYMQNGLVRIGFNRIDGEVYLSKYDPTSEEYIQTNVFKLNADVRFDKGIFNDDKIEILADTMVFTMWRGHPYVMINHPNNDIEIKDTFTKVYGEASVGGMPSLINLMNEDNLLPECVGGGDISSKCIETVANYENLVENHTISCVPIEDTITENTEIQFEYLFDDEENPNVASQVRFVVGGSEITGDTYTFQKAGSYDVYAVYLGDDLNHYAVSPSIQVNVAAPTTFPPQETPAGQEPSYTDKNAQTNTPSITGKFDMTCDIPDGKHFVYRDQQTIWFTLRRGGTPIAGKVVELAVPTGNVYTNFTDANGQVFVTNDWKVTPGNYVVQATFYDQVNEDYDPQVVYQAQRKIVIDKRPTTITSSTNTVSSGGFAVFNVNVNGKIFEGLPVYVEFGSGKKTFHTNASGNIRVQLFTKKTFKFKVTYPGNSYNLSATLKKNVKVK